MHRRETYLSPGATRVRRLSPHSCRSKSVRRLERRRAVLASRVWRPSQLFATLVTQYLPSDSFVTVTSTCDLPSTLVNRKVGPVLEPFGA